MELTGSNGEKYNIEKNNLYWCKLFYPKFLHDDPDDPKPYLCNKKLLINIVICKN